MFNHVMVVSAMVPETDRFRRVFKNDLVAYMMANMKKYGLEEITRKVTLFIIAFNSDEDIFFINLHISFG